MFSIYHHFASKIRCHKKETLFESFYSLYRVSPKYTRHFVQCRNSLCKWKIKKRNRKFFGKRWKMNFMFYVHHGVRGICISNACVLCRKKNKKKIVRAYLWILYCVMCSNSNEKGKLQNKKAKKIFSELFIVNNSGSGPIIMYVRHIYKCRNGRWLAFQS